MRRIVILGFMGSGKTTVADALASQLQLAKVDLDEIITEREKTTVPDLIKEKGEEAFRRAETLVLSIVLESDVAPIIALGGGAWMVERNRELLGQYNCLTVFLDAPFELCWQRITEQDAIRPLALDRSRAHQLYRERHPIYELADLRVSVSDETSADELAAEIVASMRDDGSSKRPR